MKSRTIKLHPSVFFIVLAFLASIGIGTVIMKSEFGVSGTVPQPQEITEIVELIREKGGRGAYEAFASSIQDDTPQEQHTAAHQFGSALYYAEGVAGLSVCDSRFSFGCFHEFLGRAIADIGLSSVNALNESCFAALDESPLSCQHGIGHGVQSSLGYDSKALFNALDVCRDLPQNDPIGGCYSGVFMEYNLQTMLGDEGRVRAVIGNDMQYPCNSVDAEYADACYYWQPQWWRQIARLQGKSNIYEIYEEIGDLCRQAPKENTRSCFEGTGNNLTPDGEFDPARLKALCETVGKTNNEKLFCKLHAASSLGMGGAGMRGDGASVCADLNGRDLEVCLGYARGDFSILMPGALD